MKFNKLIYGCALTSVLVLASCDDLLDINTDPNNPATSTPQLTLPAAQVQLATQVESRFNMLGSILAQYWTQGPTASQYSIIERYDLSTVDYREAWAALYAGNPGAGFDSGVLSDLEFVKKAGLESELPNYAAIAQLLQAYTFQVLVDLYDKVPYSEALQGKEGNLTPVFEDGDVIYASLIGKIDEAVSWISASSPTPGDDDLIFGGDMAMWQKFANTLKLKIYIRESFANETHAQAGIQSMFAGGAPEFLGPDEHVFISFSTATGSENPLFQELEINTPENIVASATGITYFADNGDQRLAAVYDPAPNSGSYIGLVQGTGTTAGGEFDDYAVPDETIILNSAAPAYLMTGYESLFLQAEAAQLGWSGEDAKTLYDAAVNASFSFWGLDGSDYVADGGIYEYDGTPEQLYEQKWAALNGKQGFEGWNEWRRTGIPVLEKSVTGKPLPNIFQLRLIWPNIETTANPNAPPLTSGDTPVWWDTTF